MNLRNEWKQKADGVSDRFYTKQETIENVTENFDIRRYHSAEGYDIEINGVMERCIVQTSSNPLRELNDIRKIQCPVSADVRRGYYVKYEGFVWIIDTNVVNVDGAYLSTRMSRCQYILRWQNGNGDIIQRWAYASDQTKYSNGDISNHVISVGDNQYGLLVPIDSETKLLKRNMRFAFDFDDAEIPDIYELTNRKIKLADGTIQLSFSFHAFNQETDKQIMIEDGSKVWICDYRPPLPPAPPSGNNETTISIIGKSDLKIGFPRTYTAAISSPATKESVGLTYEWQVVSDFEVGQHMNGTTIELLVDDKTLVGACFILRVVRKADMAVMAELEITISELM